VVSLAPIVDWIKEARWLQDGTFFIPSGVSVRMDMALALMADLFGMTMADKIAKACDYEWHKDANRNSYAKSTGLI
jgi:transcriptional regulator GlxA family with amidase domain